MANPIAVLIEDDAEQTEFSRGVLEASRYIVRSFDSIAPARDYLYASEDLIDLFVLDRRLPVNKGELATDELGDELLSEVRSRYPDARLVVFTGFATIRHVQKSLQGGGQLPARDGQPIDRVTVLQKDQSIEFEEHLRQLRDLLQELDDIEITACAGVTLSTRDKRTLRRLAFDYGAVSISAKPLDGGLTGAGVWRCGISRQEGSVSNVVAKRAKEPASPGGVPELLPRVNTAAPIRTLSGLMGGEHLNILQLAGKTPFALMEIIADEPVRAVELAKPIWQELRGVAVRRATLTVADLCKCLVEWESLSRILGSHGVEAPKGSLLATTQIAPRHGDLHPGNILIDNGRPVLIDFDSMTFAAGLLDPVTMLISTLVHPASPIRGCAWPTVTEIKSNFASPNFGQHHRCEVWFRGVNGWVTDCQTSEREFWALTLAYVGRQLRYPDVLEDQEIVDRLLAIANRAVDALSD